MLLCMAALSVCTQPAGAINPGQATTGDFSDPGSDWYGMNWDSVGVVRAPDGDVTGSCVAISDRYFLTADHMNLQAGVHYIECDGITYLIEEAIPNTDLFGSGSPADLALVKVSRAAAQTEGPIIPYHSSLYDDELALGQELILSGYGKAGAEPYGVKRWGTNRQASQSRYGIQLATNDSDTEYEAVAGDKDSGGGIFARSASGQWEYAGTFTFATSGPSSTAYTERIIEMTFAGDFDSDGDMDLDDLQTLTAAVSTGSTSSVFDMDGDYAAEATADYGDLEYFIRNALQWHNGVEGGYGTQRGDFNLDGQINGVDLSILAGHFGVAGTWSDGDADLDGQVGGTDLSVLGAGQGFLASADPNFIRVSHWTQPAGVTGDWSDPANWSGQLDSEIVEIGNDGIALISQAAELDGKLIVGGYRGATGRLLVGPGADLAVETVEMGRFASGGIEQTGGTFTIAEAELLSGDVELSGGELNITDLLATGGPRVLQTGGVAALGTGLLEDGAEYHLAGGLLTVTGAMTVAYDGVFRWSGGALAANNLVLENGGDLLMGFDFSVADLVDGTLSGGALSGLGQGDLCIGNSATATHESLSFSPSGLHVGNEAGDVGSYELSGSGALSPAALSVGAHGQGTFVQTGGTATPGILVVGYHEGAQGVYRLSGGTVNTGFVFIGTNPNLEFGENVPGGEGVLEWFGGSLQVGTQMAFRDQGTLAMGFDFTMSDLVDNRSLIGGGTIMGLDVGALEITNGAIATHDAIATIVGTLVVSGSSLSTYEMQSGANLTATGVIVAGSQGEYGLVDMAAGSALTVTGHLDVGPHDPASGIDNTLGGVRMAGGALSAETLSLGRSASPTAPTAGVGRLIVLGAADITVHETLHFGAAGEIFAPGGLQITMDSANFENERSTSSPAGAASFGNLTLLFEGDPSAANTFEIACADFGLSDDGFAGNFALEQLLIGSASSIGMVQLVDVFDNAPSGDVLYVDTLHILAGSSFDLNGFTVYVHDLVVDAGAFLTDTTRPGQPQLWDIYVVDPAASGMAPVPEPATLGLLALTGLALLRRRR